MAILAYDRILEFAIFIEIIPLDDCDNDTPVPLTKAHHHSKKECCIYYIHMTQEIEFQVACLVRQDFLTFQKKRDLLYHTNAHNIGISHER